jgi:hypothetical protein
LGSVPVTGCGTLKNGQGWGENALYPLDLKRIPHAAYTALLDPKTLIPAAGALVFTGNDFDEKVSSWAAKHNPIFGSKENAANASDYLLNTLYAETILTAFATPSGDDPENWIYWKTKGIAVELIALGATEGATDLLKNATSRTRPDGSDNKSFPSSHSSSSFCSATLANRNLNSIPLSDPVRIPLQVGNILLATSVAWARVEAQKHFPSDALVGAALGNFLGAFIHDAFLGLPQDNGFSFTVFPLKGGARAEFYFAF